MNGVIGAIKWNAICGEKSSFSDKTCLVTSSFDSAAATAISRFTKRSLTTATDIYLQITKKPTGLIKFNFHAEKLTFNKFPLQNSDWLIPKTNIIGAFAVY